MIGKKILILGSRSFAATGLYDLLLEAGFEVTCFNRGKEAIKGNFVSGNILELQSNKYLNNKYDAVINYILLKDQDIESNINYIKEVVGFCKKNNVKHLIQISSISVYPNDEEEINECSEIEDDFESKGSYASVKIAVDKYLMTVTSQDFTISFIRPGFIIAERSNVSLAGIIKSLPFGINILLGDKETTLPTVKRDLLHKAILLILSSEALERVYLILSNPAETKYKFVKDRQITKLIILPKTFTLFVAKFLKNIKVFNKTQYNQIKGLFKTTYFDCTHTEHSLKTKF
jgi:nucleoside-diphosphate-sugar epimerase